MSKLYELAEKLGNILLQKKLHCAVAESCTGGLLSAAITDVAGSSEWFERGFITYTNLSKQEMLSVPASILSIHGAVSKATVQAMAAGVLTHSQADASIAISGIAGPSGGTLEKPVGMVWIAWATPTRANLPSMHAECYVFKGDRAAVREQSVIAALEGLIHLIREK